MPTCKKCGNRYSFWSAEGLTGIGLCSVCQSAAGGEISVDSEETGSPPLRPQHPGMITRNMAATLRLVVAGAIIGLIAGYPLSYFFQPGVLRAKLSLGDYITHMGEVFGDKQLAGTAFGVWIGSVVVFAGIGWIVGAAMNPGKQ